ncbi:hypothetical protein [Salinivibrio costicola]|uniref:hypothetical protein n=1 Tax=Salinivibrio costicola TaxID=51367 RepID=UPI000471DEF6|nr:hypothetical protein [Salinivibrio costicola]
MAKTTLAHWLLVGLAIMAMGSLSSLANVHRHWGQFDWLLALHGLWLAWASLYWARSRRVKHFFFQFTSDGRAMA